ncbi:uncharacterized protein PADG_08577 [Paracoccidioides brasiliensis Pb18]|uniref:Isoleucyl-tRNA synthetase n=1 Tax=Paracoccidioides brasiliensis (strain Pb18) TaxID=502780 RepID=C1GMT3_PARBD|nr:uncharacterized protein PADG_08577 [Paracoccidioides brasiliensis Pb18]EEH44935.1 hypothetical protein PADG_08577 [Paracoccidioides brasiliensis Pb18]
MSSSTSALMTTSRNVTPAQIFPGRGIGFLTLGASLHNTLTRLKANPHTYPSIDLSYSSSNPIHAPVLITLPENGLRLRFDGPDQRLRLIEVLDFTKISLTYKSHDVLKSTKSTDQSPQQGPSFRHIYNRMFGPSYPGEFFPSSCGSLHGTYVLSYPGVAFSFPLLQSAWSEQCDFVSLMSSSAASSATSMAVFQGSSWLDGRSNLYTRQPQYPRSTALSGKNRESVADEIEEVKVHGAGRVEFLRRAGSSFCITLSETTPQDLVSEFGPPDAIYRKNDRRISIHGDQSLGNAKLRHTSPSFPGCAADPTDIDPLSETSVTDESDGENSPTFQRDCASLATECFYNYFDHGFDALISHPTVSGPPFPASSHPEASVISSGPQLTVTKLLLHGNVPGSYPFNRHRRSRWSLNMTSSMEPLTSETPYDQISNELKRIWKGSHSSPSEEMALQRGMVLNRGWGDSPGSSVELLGGWEDNTTNKHLTGSETDGGQTLGNTELFGFPGLVFEVLKNRAISCLTVY